MVLTLPSIDVRGTHYEVGFAIGSTFRQQIHDFWNGYKFLEEEVVPFYRTKKGEDYYQGYLKAARDHYPQYVEEVKGISDGSEMPFFKIFLLQVNMEYDALLHGGQQHGCSTVYVHEETLDPTGRQEPVCLMGHNEDVDPIAKSCGYVVKAKIEDTGFEEAKDEEEFTVYSYPGFLPGRSMGFTANGMVFAQNALYPECLPPDKTPRAFLNRATLTATTFDEVLEILKDEGCGVSTAFSANVGFVKGGRREIRNFEVFPPLEGDTCSRVTQVRIASCACPSPGFHFNVAEHSPGVVEDPSARPNSLRRRAVAESLAPTLTGENVRAGVLGILGDDSDAEFPIFRTRRRVDPIITAATALFDLVEGTWEIFLDNPKTSKGALVELRMK